MPELPDETPSARPETALTIAFSMISGIGKGLLCLGALIGIQYVMAYGISLVWWPWIGVPFTIVVTLAVIGLIGAAGYTVTMHLWKTSPRTNVRALRRLFSDNPWIIPICICGAVAFGLHHALNYLGLNEWISALAGMFLGFALFDSWDKPEPWFKKIAMLVGISAILGAFGTLLYGISRLPRSAIVVVCLLALAASIVLERRIKK